MNKKIKMQHPQLTTLDSAFLKFIYVDNHFENIAN